MELISTIDEELENCCCFYPDYFYDIKNKEVVCKNCASIIGSYLCLDERLKDDYENKHNEIITPYSRTLQLIPEYDTEYNFKKWKFLYYKNLDSKPRISMCKDYLDILISSMEENVPEYIKTSALKYIDQGFKDRITLGGNIEALAEASLFFSYELFNKKKDIKTFFSLFNIPASIDKIRHFRKMVILLEENYDNSGSTLSKFINPLQYIDGLMNYFESNNNVRRIIKNAIDSNILNLQRFVGKSLVSVLCGLFYYYSKKNNNESITIPMLSEYSGYTASVITKRHMDFCRLKLKSELCKNKTLTRKDVEKILMTKTRNKIVSNLELMIKEFPEFKKEIKTLLDNYHPKKIVPKIILDLGPKI